MTIQTTMRQMRSDAGFSIAEVMISTLIFAVISSVVISGMLSMNNISRTVSNRTEMHSGVRNATELLQQEVGQAGRAVLPQDVQLGAAVTAGSTSMTVTAPGGALAPTSGMFNRMYLVVGIDSSRETVEIQAIDTVTNTLTLAESFLYDHVAGSPITMSGGFAEGIIPPSLANGSTASVLKMLGDIQSDGSMVYVEYTCDFDNHKLYRNVMAWNAGAKPAKTDSMVLLDNLEQNPGNTPCFTYQEEPIDGHTCVVGVAITLTVQTQDKDPNTGEYQKETKALLNVAPRNVFNVWQIASLGGLEFRVQPLPQTVVANLLPNQVVTEAD